MGEGDEFGIDSGALKRPHQGLAEELSDLVVGDDAVSLSYFSGQEIPACVLQPSAFNNDGIASFAKSNL
ncbi:MAG: hypothetical protein ACD_75C01827G0004 [uncultured bacterium]|nr:MAG: hypothetical protein ACD_75C01827G0004 [uncultured bacterium]